jgi:DNA-directed RNA polymerase specialized sigma24 family protein
MEVVNDLPWVYGAALAAASSEAGAQDATERAFRGARAGDTRRALIAEAVRVAIRTDPAEPFDALDPEDAEALALVRIAGLCVAEVAALTGHDRATVKRRLTVALRSLSRPRLVAC